MSKTVVAERKKHSRNVKFAKVLQEGTRVKFRSGRLKGLTGVIEEVMPHHSDNTRRVRLLNAMGQGDDLVFEAEIRNLIKASNR